MSITPSTIISEAHGDAGTLAKNVEGAVGEVRAFNEALTWLHDELDGLDATWTLDSTTTPALVAGTAEYALPSDFMRVRLEQGRPLVFWFNDTVAGTVPTLLDPIGLDLAEEQTTASTPNSFYEILTSAGRRFVLVPKPVANTGRVFVRYKARLAMVTSTTVGNAIALPEQFADALRYRVAAALAGICELTDSQQKNMALAQGAIGRRLVDELSMGMPKSWLGRRRR